MEQNEDLARLEQYIENLIASHNQLKSDNSDLNAQLQAKQQEIVELQEMIKNLQDDRSVMHNRVTGLIDRIGEWEKTFDQNDVGSSNKSGEVQTKNLSKKSSTLFSVSSEQSPETAVRD